MFAGKAVVSVAFFFYNNSIDKTIDIGFQKWCSDKNYITELEFSDYKAYINNECVFFDIMDGTAEKNMIIDKWYTKSVHFESDETTEIKIIYSAPSGIEGSYRYLCEYLYGTGRNRKGDIGEMEINLRFADGVRIHDFRFPDQAIPYIQVMTIRSQK